MSPRLRCRAGPSPNSLFPIEINSTTPKDIKSDHFHGKIAVYLKYDSPARSRSPTPIPSSLSDDEDLSYSEAELEARRNVPLEAPEYFMSPRRKGVTWSIQVQGRFLEEVSADDVLFGNTFDQPLSLPWGSSAVLKFMHYKDPTLEHDFDSKRPWALSPLISTMPYFHHRRLSTSDSTSSIAFPGNPSLKDDVKNVRHKGNLDVNGAKAANDRRAYFGTKEKRKNVVFDSNDLITADFCHGHLSFPSLALSLPGGVSFDLAKRWPKDMPVRFVCCKRNSGGSPLDSVIYWCVVFDVVDNDEEGSDDDLLKPTS